MDSSEFVPSPKFDQDLQLTVNLKYSCPICQLPLINAVSTNCNHTFCRLCLTKWKRHFQECPVCKQPISYVLPRTKIDQKIKKLFQLGTEDLQADRRMCLNYRKFQQKQIDLAIDDKDKIAKQVLSRAQQLNFMKLDDQEASYGNMDHNLTRPTRSPRNSAEDFETGPTSIFGYSSSKDITENFCSSSNLNTNQS